MKACVAPGNSFVYRKIDCCSKQCMFIIKCLWDQLIFWSMLEVCWGHCSQTVQFYFRSVFHMGGGQIGLLTSTPLPLPRLGSAHLSCKGRLTSRQIIFIVISWNFVMGLPAFGWKKDKFKTGKNFYKLYWLVNDMCRPGEEREKSHSFSQITKALK